MTWEYILVLTIILLCSWKMGQPLVAKKEGIKRGAMDGSNSR